MLFYSLLIVEIVYPKFSYLQEVFPDITLFNPLRSPFNRQDSPHFIKEKIKAEGD